MRRSRLLTPVLVVALLANALAVLALAAVLLDRSASAADPAVGAKAFARVTNASSTPVLNASRSRNVLGVAKAGEGKVCLTLGVAVKNVVASVNEVSTGFATAGLVPADGGGFNCPAGADVVVRTFDEASGAPRTLPFCVMMH